MLNATRRGEAGCEHAYLGVPFLPACAALRLFVFRWNFNLHFCVSCRRQYFSCCLECCRRRRCRGLCRCRCCRCHICRISFFMAHVPWSHSGHPTRGKYGNDAVPGVCAWLGGASCPTRRCRSAGSKLNRSLLKQIVPFGAHHAKAFLLLSAEPTHSLDTNQCNRRRLRRATPPGKRAAQQRQRPRRNGNLRPRPGAPPPRRVPKPPPLPPPALQSLPLPPPPPRR